MTGTLLNMATVLVGGLLGTIAGRHIPMRFRETVMNGIGLITAVIAISMAIVTHNILIPMGAVLIGGLVGETLRIQRGMDRLGAWAERRLGASMSGDAVEGWSVARAFVTTSLVFCVGPLTILGSIQDGLLGDYKLLAIKSALDGFASLVFAAALGPGVLLTIGSIFVIQGGISLAAMGVGTAMGSITETTPWIIEMKATGGVLLLAIALGLLDLKNIRTANLLPAVIVAPALTRLVETLSRALGHS
ncbi:MAG TPA: DUF554 domain-containing protein [Candidatus Hydrogenedentes bacterium]|nr:DUF554 domain-containing protein [Candidatus Hydrogenedentota bacterium]HOS02727.1 DUF554 domain-containing protein [Candidatus Hydrogenedentota bacterium]